VQWPLLRLFAGFLVLTIAGVIWAFLLEDGSKLRDSSALCLFWSWYNILILALACLVCVEQPRLRSADRLPVHDQVAMIDAGEGASAYRILDISLGGTRCAGALPATPGATVTIGLGHLRMPGEVIRSDANSFAIGFRNTGDTRADLIRFIYSGRYSATVPRIVPARVAAAILGRVVR
jgi:cellulose synthase (UDP-forming)